VFTWMVKLTTDFVLWKSRKWLLTGTYTPFLDVKNLVSIITGSTKTKAKKIDVKALLQIYDVIEKCQVVLNVKSR
jgi:hypothetical protein